MSQAAPGIEAFKKCGQVMRGHRHAANVNTAHDKAFLLTWVSSGYSQAPRLEASSADPAILRCWCSLLHITVEALLIRYKLIQKEPAAVKDFETCS